MIDAGAAVEENPMPCRQKLKRFRVVALERLDKCGPIGQCRFAAIGLVNQAMQELESRGDLSCGQIGMRPQPQPRVRGGICLRIAGELNVCLHIPQHTEITVTHRANPLCEFEQVGLMRWRVLQYTGAINE